MWPGPTSAPSAASSSGASISISSAPSSITFRPEEDNKKCEPERQYNETFSKSSLLERIEQYNSGKLTRRYVEAYLEFCHLSNYLTNLEYLEIRGNLFPKE